MDDLRSQQYRQQLAKQLRHIYNSIRSGYQAPEQLRARCEGFMQAGMLLGVADKSQLEQIIEQVHLEVFGMSSAQRRAQQQREPQPRQRYEEFEIPTWVRKGQEPPSIGPHR